MSRSAHDSTATSKSASGSGDAVSDDDSVEISKMRLRPGGWIGYGEDALYVARDDEKIQIRNDDVVQLALRTVEWDLIIMSVLLVGIGGYIAATRNPLVGTGFAVAGALSLYRSYRRRYELSIHVVNRPKPLVVHPDHPAECHETFVEQTGLRAD